MSTLSDLYALCGQSFWYDNLSRELLRSGAIERLVREDGLRGLTSNPTIFEKATAHSQAYDEDIARLLEDRSPEEVALSIMMSDIRAAADVLRPVFDASDGGDGFASIEMSPDLAHDTDGAIAMARRLWKEIDRPNVMIKIPGTLEGIDAVEAAIASGVNVNITLLFAVERYEAVMQAYLRGLERRPGDLSRGSASVASFFLSRVDTKVDARLPEGSPLRGEAAISNAKIAYEQFHKTFTSARWESLAARGAKKQRPLWASTSTKNPAYSKTKYFEPLLGPDTVNTMPDALIEAVRAWKGELHPTIEDGVGHAQLVVAKLPFLDEVTRELEVEGIADFAKSWNNLVRAIEAKRLAKTG